MQSNAVHTLSKAQVVQDYVLNSTRSWNLVRMAKTAVHASGSLQCLQPRSWPSSSSATFDSIRTTQKKKKKKEDSWSNARGSKNPLKVGRLSCGANTHRAPYPRLQRTSRACRPCGRACWLIHTASCKIRKRASVALLLIVSSAEACHQQPQGRQREREREHARDPDAEPQKDVDVSLWACLEKALPAAVKSEGGFGFGYVLFWTCGSLWT